MSLAPRDMIRFAAHVALDVPPRGCWEWTGEPAENGYGRFNLAGEQPYAHRVAYEAFVGPIPAGLFVLHRCDNPPCVNPDHLYAGTAADNSRDLRERGLPFGGKRGRRGPRMVDLQREHVLEIRRLSADGVTVSEIARRFGTSRSTAHRVATRQVFAEVE